MFLLHKLGLMVEYISEAAITIFSPNDDDYPEVGTQPFEGESFDGNIPKKAA